jgi:radical SAM protein (TIGR01212 family)
VWLELGLQTVHEETARRIRRGYPLAVFADAYRRLKAEGFPVVVHLIFGLPGESREDMLESVRYLAALDPPPDGVKLQMLHILEGTELGEAYKRQPFPLLSLEEYADLIEESAAILPPETVFHRITGDGPGKLLLAPDWTRNKKRVLNTINARLREMGE